MPHSLSTHLEFNPPPGQHWRGPVAWALLIHGLLVLALTWGVTWKQDVQVAVEAELWSKLPQVAAPRANEPDTPPPPTPAPTPPKPQPEPQAKPEPAPPPKAQVDIALQKKLAELKKQEELRQQREAQALADKQKKAERLKAEQDKAQKAKERDQALAEQKKKDEAQRKADEARREAQLEADRQKNLARMMGLAGATGGSTAKGKDLQTSGPSASYAGKLVARIKPNIVFTDSAPGNPRAEVEVRTLPDGTIVGRKILKPSGHDGWDEAVLRAIDRTATLPKDENGKVPSTLILGFKPLD